MSLALTPPRLFRLAPAQVRLLPLAGGFEGAGEAEPSFWPSRPHGQRPSQRGESLLAPMLAYQRLARDGQRPGMARHSGQGPLRDLPRLPRLAEPEVELASVWVIGKEPKGKGWRLDPTYEGDTSRWLEVKGWLRPCGSSRCLRAQSIALVPRPDASPSP